MGGERRIRQKERNEEAGEEEERVKRERSGKRKE